MKTKRKIDEHEDPAQSFERLRYALSLLVEEQHLLIDFLKGNQLTVKPPEFFHDKNKGNYFFKK